MKGYPRRRPDGGLRDGGLVIRRKICHLGCSGRPRAVQPVGEKGRTEKLYHVEVVDVSQNTKLVYSRFEILALEVSAQIIALDLHGLHAN